MKTNPNGKGIRSVIPQEPLSLVTQMYNIFSNRNLPSTSEDQPSATAIFCHVFGGLLDNPDEQFKRYLLMPGIEVYVRCYLACEGKLSIPDETVHTCIFVHKLTCIEIFV